MEEQIVMGKKSRKSWAKMSRKSWTPEYQTKSNRSPHYPCRQRNKIAFESIGDARDFIERKNYHHQAPYV